jgi:Rieske Fe-S protein
MALVLIGPVASFTTNGPPVDISGSFTSGTPKPMLTRFADGADGSPQFSAVSSICTHQGCPILTGSGDWNTTDQPIYDPATKIITCPCHGSQFNVATGAVVAAPARKPLAKFAVQITGSNVYVDGDPMPPASVVASK